MHCTEVARRFLICSKPTIGSEMELRATNSDISTEADFNIEDYTGTRRCLTLWLGLGYDSIIYRSFNSKTQRIESIGVIWGNDIGRTDISRYDCLAKERSKPHSTLFLPLSMSQPVKER